MSEIRLKDFSSYLKKRYLYAIRSDKEKEGIKIYPFSRFGMPGALVVELPYSYEEWIAFLRKHNCCINGDYKGSSNQFRFFHVEHEDGIGFEIAAGKEEGCHCDWIRIL